MRSRTSAPGSCHALRGTATRAPEPLTPSPAVSDPADDLRSDTVASSPKLPVLLLLRWLAAPATPGVRMRMVAVGSSLPTVVPVEPLNSV